MQFIINVADAGDLNTVFDGPNLLLDRLAARIISRTEVAAQYGGRAVAQIVSGHAMQDIDADAELHGWQHVQLTLDETVKKYCADMTFTWNVATGELSIRLEKSGRLVGSAMLGNLVFAANPAAVEHFGAKISAQWAARFLSQIYRLEELEAIVTRLERHTDGSRNLVHYVADGKELTTTKALAWLDEHVRLGVGPALTQAVIAGAPPLPA